MTKNLEKNKGVLFPVEVKLTDNIVCKGNAFLFSHRIKMHGKKSYKSVSFLCFL